MKPGFSLVQCPDFQLMRERAEFGPREQISQLRSRGWNAASHLVSPDSRENDAISLSGKASGELPAGLVGTLAGSGCDCDFLFVEFESPRLFLAYIDVAACAPPFFFNLREIRPFVPVGLGVVVMGDRVEGRCLACSTSEDVVCESACR